MKITTLISGSLALALVATSLTPAFTAPLVPAGTSAKPAFDHVQYRNNDDDEDQVRRPRRDGGEQNYRGEDGERRSRGEDGQRRPRGEAERPNRQPQADSGRAERRGEVRRDERAERRDQRRQHRFERRGNQAYYNGQRGYREQRRGYRYYEGFWFPPAAFVLGAIIAGQNNNYRRDDWEDHVDWCYERYGRNYRERDNTYVSRSGYRRECVSPFS